MDLELKVLKKEVGSLEINYEEFKAELENAVQTYRDLKVISDLNGYDLTADIVDRINGFTIWKDCKTGDRVVSFSDAKKIRARLNNVGDIINDRKIALKKEFLRPYEIVESQAKELISIIAATNKEIDAQIKASELREKEEKQQQIVKLWEDKKYNDFGIAFTEVFDSKWLNKTYNLTNIGLEMDAKYQKFSDDLKVIEQLIPNANERTLITTKYLLNPNLSEVIRDYNIEKEKAKEVIAKQPKPVVEEKPKFYSITITGLSEEEKDKLLELLVNFNTVVRYE